ncbi:CCA-adding enzyme [Methanobrevibacter sp. 87.7]|uniref:CCA tRNA nucleotidyltransferase n=1 Tax=Methanobrevibacter sp. 87.7 TaxID=387957 RepID=UPI000B505B2B|nr:CCA tRNA nucleotidyltransferase [Methanobrevibacter sp. 87.7]OWT32736.1 CCA-adding enzyme [Methanobrevibacter sp. 87.7]
MTYREILKEITPNNTEKEEIREISNKLIDNINRICKKNNINAEGIKVGSVAKKTFLHGKSDIDIFISFPIETPIETLKEKGLDIAYKVTEENNGISNQHFASHPYLTSIIDNYEIDFVPCYNIKNAEEMKSAVDRTILHTKYIKSHLKEEQIPEVLLLKQFMDCVGVYGSEFKVGGFAGYLCEMLIIKYGNFENLIKEVSNWKYGTIIDLENYGTADLFDDPLIAIDPTDKNRNVGAALRIDKMEEFVEACRNFEKSNNKIEFFYPIKKDNLTIEKIINEFTKHGGKTYIIEFDIPNVVADTLHPQLKKTEESLREKFEEEDFKVFKSGYWTNEKDKGILIFEMEVYKLNNIKVHYGPKIWAKKACENFKKANGENCYCLNEFLVINKKREFINVTDFIEHIFKPENIHRIKIGKNLKEPALKTCKFYLLENYLKIVNKEDLNDLLEYLDNFINSGQKTRR